MATNNRINSDIPIEITKGGTQATALTDHSVLVGSGTTAITPLTVGTDGQLLLGASAADPAFSTITSTGGSITLTPGVNSLNLETTAGSNSFILGSANTYISYPLRDPGYQNFLGSQSFPSTSYEEASIVMPIAGTISNLYVYNFGLLGTSTQTVNINNSDTAITVASSGIGLQSDTVNTAAVAIGDLLSLKIISDGTFDQTGSFSILFTPS